MHSALLFCAHMVFNSFRFLSFPQPRARQGRGILSSDLASAIRNTAGDHTVTVTQHCGGKGTKCCLLGFLLSSKATVHWQQLMRKKRNHSGRLNDIYGKVHFYKILKRTIISQNWTNRNRYRKRKIEMTETSSRG